MKPRILAVDDETEVLDTLSALLSKKGYAVATAENGHAALSHLDRGDFNVVLSDLKMSGMDGLQLLTAVKEISPDTEVILFTGHGTVESAVTAMKSGAYNYIIKPIDADEVILLIERILYVQNLKKQNRLLQSQLDSRYDFSNIIGKNHCLQQILELVRDVASSNATVLIQGESGTGKELSAHAIHFHSSRRDKPLVKVN